MYSLPSASHTLEPLPRTMYGGSPPTDLNALTGESTPPGITRHARACSCFDFSSRSMLPTIKHHPRRTNIECDRHVSLRGTMSRFAARTQPVHLPYFTALEGRKILCTKN